MAVNAVSGPHGRDIGVSEATEPQRNASVTFHDVLEAINPLQYLPGIGTIYRLATGDQGIPQLRAVGSLVGGLLTGGPLGVLVSLAGVAADHYLHFDQRLASLFGHTPVAVAAVHGPATPSGGTPAAAAADAVAAANSAAGVPVTPPVAASVTGPVAGPVTGPVTAPLAASVATPEVGQVTGPIVATAIAAYGRADSLVMREAGGGRERES